MATPDEVARLAAENERLKAELEAREASGGGRRRTRGVIFGILVVLTSLCVALTTVGVWVNRTIWNTDRYLALVAPLIRDPEVTDALAVKLTEETFTALNVQSRVEQALAQIPKLPESADSLLAGPLVAGAQSVVQNQVKTFLATDAFANLWVEINRAAHEKVVALLNGDYDQLPNVDITGGEVRLNFVSAVAGLLQQLVQSGANALGLSVTIPDIPPDLDASAAIQRLGSALGVTLPADFGQLTIMTENQLTGYQQAAKNVKRLAGGLFLLSVILLVITILVAPNRRRGVMWLGLGIALALFLGGVAIRKLEANLVDAITGQGGKAAARDVFTQVTHGLRRVGLLVLLIALVAGVVAYFMGRPAWFERAKASTKRATASRPQGSELEVWLSAHADPVRIGGAILAAVVLFIAGINWISVAIVGALFALLMWEVSVAQRKVHPAEEPSQPEAG